MRASSHSIRFIFCLIVLLVLYRFILNLYVQEKEFSNTSIFPRSKYKQNKDVSSLSNWKSLVNDAPSSKETTFSFVNHERKHKQGSNTRLSSDETFPTVSVSHRHKYKQRNNTISYNQQIYTQENNSRPSSHETLHPAYVTRQQRYKQGNNSRSPSHETFPLASVTRQQRHKQGNNSRSSSHETFPPASVTRQQRYKQGNNSRSSSHETLPIASVTHPRKYKQGNHTRPLYANAYLTAPLTSPQKDSHVNSLRKNRPLSTAYIDRHLRYNNSYPSKSTYGHHDILWWNRPPWMEIEHWVGYCDTSLCEYPNCKVINDRTHFNHSSAVIISLVDGGTEQVPVPRSQRNINQTWVFFTLESPMSLLHQEFRNEEWQNVFNWSMTYRRDADISIPYGWLGKQQALPNRNYSDIFHKKTKQAAWVVSHCSTYSKREEYVKQLQEYIDVDIYGGCGTKIKNDILDETMSKYKFYLAFENALCKDYVTEKAFWYFTYDIVIVARGSADYSQFPNDTLINTGDFSSIKSLGQYLAKLANNEEEYTNYLKEKDRYKVLQRWDTYCDGLCHICEKVNNLDDNRRTYRSAFDWTGGCADPTDLH